MAFNAKNLTYERNEPAFLRKLRGQYGDGDSRRPTHRPRKAKENDDEDAPVYVDEETNEALSKEDYESLLNGTEAKGETAGHGAEEGKESTNPAAKSAEQVSNEEAKTQQNLAEIGTAQKKRRKAKVIHDEEVAEDESRHKVNPAAPKPSAKRKKIKLSFDEPE
ncbi:hypothetical protein UA08_06581 [Talaromyces atroroseus]|uniref:DUF4604 domain-containing protein n=1 Tax=Talaromyces atroroseus TaxID=1441469 RepID=A0A225ACD5_TALAT|nr:hypothetical protein UA08_06581 [Talaromyces atroroseus]OKL58030.1 hypothetical protein UA08_06581 [Talaromyces atroroseus]